jgi:hypothetical protein
MKQAGRMSIEHLSARIRTQRIKRRALEPATIAVRRGDPCADCLRFSGRVLLDGQQLGYLVGGEPRTFHVDPGDHTITVYFGRRSAFFASRRRAVSSASVSLCPGERADFNCGIRPDVARQWMETRRAVASRAIIFFAVVLLAGEAGSWLTTFLRDAVALAVFHLPVYGSLIPILHRIVSPLFCALWFALLARWILGRLAYFPSEETDEELLARIGSPYFLEHLAAVGINETRADPMNHRE